MTERNGFADRFTRVVERIGPGGLSRRQAARELDIEYATLNRLLDDGRPPGVVTKSRRMPLPSVAGRYTFQNEVTNIIAQR